MPLSTQVESNRRNFGATVKQVNPVLFGITNCDTVKKARKWLDGLAVPYKFHDFKKQGLPLSEIDRWIGDLGFEKLINRRGPTWRKLDKVIQDSVVDAASAKAVMQMNSSVIKRPVVQWPTGKITVGFDETEWTSLAVSVDSRK